MPCVNGPLKFDLTFGKWSKVLLLQIDNLSSINHWMSTATFSILIRGHDAHLEDDDEGDDEGDDHDDELQQ